MKNDFNRNPRTEVAVVYDNGIGKISPKKRNALTFFGGSTEGAMLQELDFEQLTEMCRATLAKNAMVNISELSNLEEALSLVAPKGSERYKLLVDAFALASAKKVMKW